MYSFAKIIQADACMSVILNMHFFSFKNVMFCMKICMNNFIRTKDKAVFFLNYIIMEYMIQVAKIYYFLKQKYFPHTILRLLLQCSVASNSFKPHELWPTRLPCPWNFSGMNTGLGYHFLLQVIFPSQGLNPSLLSLLHWQADSLPLCYLGSTPYQGI